MYAAFAVCVHALGPIFAHVAPCPFRTHAPAPRAVSHPPKPLMAGSTCVRRTQHASQVSASQLFAR